jgi:hypothetical protein
MLLYLVYGKRKLHFVTLYILNTLEHSDALWLFHAVWKAGGHRGHSRGNGPFISLKNGSFKEPLLSVHFACILGMRYPWAMSLLQEREGATHYETANG